MVTDVVLGILWIWVPLQNSFFGFLLPQLLLTALQPVHLDHVGALSLVLAGLGFDILKMNHCI